MKTSTRQFVFFILPLVLLVGGLPIDLFGQTPFFNYSRYLFGPQSTLFLWVVSVDTTSGEVELNGVDTRPVTEPFHWIWGDGSASGSWFPATHTYADTGRNYVVRVVATYSPTERDTVEAVVHFVPHAVTPIVLSPVIAVHIPDTNVTFATRLYSPPTGLIPFADTFFRAISRSTLEYVLSVAATEQSDFVNDDMYLFRSMFEQYMMRDRFFGGAYSLWFTDPVAFGVGDPFMQGQIGYSSLFHEMGHNFTLNTPAGFYYGGRIDGDANAIYSETMAQIFQHATGYEVVNGYQAYGLSEALMHDIKQDVVLTIKGLRQGYEDYLSAGTPFASWNDPGTPVDETMLTFGTLAYKFCAHAESAGVGYRQPLKRMLMLLQGFNADWEQRYDRLNNSAHADTFRATLMVTAISYAFAEDLRDEFRQLDFPISDEIYDELYNSPVPVQLASFVGTVLPANVVRLEWMTLSEINNYGFEVQRRSDAQAVFTTLPNSFVPGHGTTNEPQHYCYNDSTATSGAWFYRLKQIDLDGAVHYCDAIRVDLLSGVEEKEIPTASSLAQNYPNPFNPVTNIGLRFADYGLMTLKVYDLLGREVATLVNEVKQPGTYTVQWDARGVTSGVYYYRLSTTNVVKTRKLVLLR